MPTTNFVEFNPTQSNQQSDATYDSNALTTGGIQTNNILPSAWLNKIYRQANAFVTAFALMLKNKGYSTSDVNVGTLASVLNNILTQADLRTPMQNIAFTPSISFSATVADGFHVPSMTGNITAIGIFGFSFGQEITLAFTQDGTGGRTVAFPSYVLSPGTVDPTPNATSMQKFKALADLKLHPLGPMTVS
jgi:hypothetical protein